VAVGTTAATHLAEGHAALATVQALYEWNAGEAEKSYRRALDIDPNAAAVHHMFGHFLLLLERFDEARVHVARAAEIDPLAPANAMTLAWPDYGQRRFDDAARKLTTVISLNPDFAPAYWGLSIARLMQGRNEEAIAAARHYVRIEPQSSHLAVIFAGAGLREEALALERKFVERADAGEYLEPVPMARLYTMLGDRERAFHWLEKALALRSEELLQLKVDPLLERLREDPRFDELIKRIGFWP
jgi:tetratricopeptide (TPR) repeat protein